MKRPKQLRLPIPMNEPLHPLSPERVRASFERLRRHVRALAFAGDGV